MNTIEDRLRDATGDVLEAVAALPERSAPGTRRGVSSLVAVGVGVAAILLIGLPLILLRGGGAPVADSQPPTSVQATAPVSTTGQTTTSASLSTTSQPPTTAIEMEQVSTPISGVEGFELAANDAGLFAAASVPNPELWDERVWRSTDGGASWLQVLTVDGEGILTDIAADGDEVDVLISGHVVDGPSALYRSVDGGETWQRLQLPLPDGAVGAAVSLVAIGDSTLVVGRSWDGVLEESFDGGQVLSSTPTGVRSLAWKLETDTFGTPVDVTLDGTVMDLEWTGDRFVAGGFTDSDAKKPAIWISTDGDDWEPSPIPDLPAGMATDGLESVVVGGNGVVIAIGGVTADGENTETVIYVMGDIDEWSRVHLTGYGFSDAVGTPWGFVTSARLSDGTGQFVVASSMDGTQWETGDQTDTYFFVGISTPTGVFANGYATDGGGDVGIWRLATP